MPSSTRRYAAAIVVALVLGVSPGIGGAADGADTLSGSADPAQLAALHDGCEGRTPHPPIRIVGDAMFKLGPAVGVINPLANGTAEDPYIIEGWCIVPVEEDVGVPSVDVSLWDTTAHLIVRDNLVDGDVLDDGQQQDWGFYLINTSNVTIANNTVTGNELVGVEVSVSTRTVITNNTIRDNGEVDNLSFGDGVFVTGGRSVAITNNTVQGNTAEGVHVRSNGTTIADNTITGNWEFGLQLQGGRARVTNNTIADNGEDGVFVDVPPFPVHPSDVEIGWNDIHGNAGNGLRVEGEDRVDARHNWWGDAAGPSGGVTDACTGEVADGDGDEIATEEGGEVCFDPWLTSPNPEAGTG